MPYSTVIMPFPLQSSLFYNEDIHDTEGDDVLMITMEPFNASVLRTLHDHQLAEGGYRRRKTDPLASDLYGTADAVILLYTLGELPSQDTEAHARLVQTLQSFQQPDGLFPGAGHPPIHGTAFAISALELLDAKPLHPLSALNKVKSREGLYNFLEALDWQRQPWGESLKGAGLYAALTLAGEVDAQWEDWYFEWLWAEADPVTGLWRRGAVPIVAGQSEDAPLFHHLAGSFHYLFNQEYRKRPLRYPERLGDTCLALYEAGELPQATDKFSFQELDVLYLMSRLALQTDYRREELEAVMRSIGAGLLAFIDRLPQGSDDVLTDDLHALCGTVCALAIVQFIMPEQVEADRKLRQVLDRRPFI